MTIKQRNVNSVIVLNLYGRLNVQGSRVLKDEAKALFESGKCVIHLNLAEVEVMDSSGLGAIISIMKDVQRLNGRLTLSNLNQFAREMFEITQLTEVFNIYPTEAEALATYV
jgi:anti-sigma B factor antagonist